MICQLRGWVSAFSVGFLAWILSCACMMRRRDSVLMDSCASECVSRRNDGGYVKGFYLEESVWF